MSVASVGILSATKKIVTELLKVLGRVIVTSS